MPTLSEVFEMRFPTGDTWARQALESLGHEFTDDADVNDVAQGWMRLGDDKGVLVDTLFVLTADRLGFGQTQADTGETNWVKLTDIVALDAIEGVPYPLEAVEVRLNGDLAMLVGWPEEFCEAVVAALTETARTREAEGRTLPNDLADPAAAAAAASADELDRLAPSAYIESDVEAVDDVDAGESSPPPARNDLFAGLLQAEADPEPHPEPEPQPEPQRPPEPQEPEPRFEQIPPPPPQELPEEWAEADTSTEPGIAPIAERMSTFFGEEGAPVEDAAAQTSPRAMTRLDEPGLEWPEPMRGVVYLGGNEQFNRRKKNVTVALAPEGFLAVASGFNSWRIEFAWDEIRSVEFEGSDEVRFTHNAKIDSNSTAMIVQLNDESLLVFQVRAKKPATLRASLAPVLAAINNRHLGGSSFTV